MRKIFIPFGLYWQYLLDITLTHIFVIYFLHKGFSAIASFFVSVDSILKIIFSVLVSNIIIKIPPWVRGRISAILKIMLVFLWFFASYCLIGEKVVVLTAVVSLFLLFKFFIFFDSMLSSEFIFLLRDYFFVDLSKSTAAQSIFIRGSTAIAPPLALLLLEAPSISKIIFIVMLIITIISIIYFRKIYFSSIIDMARFSHSQKQLSFIKIIKNPLMRWGLFYQVLANLAFSGVAFLFLALLNPQGNAIFNEITMLYLSFLFVQFLVIFFGEKIIPIHTTSTVGLIMGVCGLFVVMAGVNHSGLMRLIMCSGIGVFYSYSLSAIQVVLTGKLREQGYMGYIGWSQMIGRLISFSVTGFLGLALSAGYSPSELLTGCGFLGIISAIVLANIPSIAYKAQDKEIIEQIS